MLAVGVATNGDHVLAMNFDHSRRITKIMESWQKTGDDNAATFS